MTGVLRIPELQPLLSYLNCSLGCLIVVLYILIVIAMKIKGKKFNHANTVYSINNSTKTMVVSERNSKRESQAAKIVTIIVLTNFLFFILPNMILTTLTVCGITTSIGTYVAILVVCNSSLNAFLYFVMDKNIRNAFCRKQMNRISVAYTTGNNDL